MLGSVRFERGVSGSGKGREWLKRKSRLGWREVGAGARLILGY